MSGSTVEPAGSAQRRVMRSERPLRSTLDWVEVRDVGVDIYHVLAGKRQRRGMGPTGGNYQSGARRQAGDRWQMPLVPLQRLLYIIHKTSETTSYMSVPRNGEGCSGDEVFATMSCSHKTWLSLLQFTPCKHNPVIRNFQLYGRSA